MDENSIDIVIPWVDGNDNEWQELYQKYKPYLNSEHSDVERFRDWDLMRYWFRGIEENMPWIRKIHFITCGHIPSWLNINHERINIVKHQDYIPTEFLPVFSSHVIEIFINRISGLSEKFIYFNDDFFVIKKLERNDFFSHDLPCDTFGFNALNCENISHIIMNNIKQINMNFSKSDVVKQNFSKIFNLKYIDKVFRSVLLMPWPRITGFYDHHLPQAYLKSTFENVWEKNSDVLNITANNKFRTNEDVNQYLFRYWQLCSGKFTPFSLYKHAMFTDISNENVEMIERSIRERRKKIIVINDGTVENFLETKKILHAAFESIYPRMSSFEIN